MSTDDAECRRQAQAAPAELRREERLEQPTDQFGLDAASGIRDLQEHVLPRSQGILHPRRLQVFRLEVGRTSRNRDPARPVSEGLRCVHDQIHDDLSNPAQVRAHQRHLDREVPPQLSALRQGCGHQARHVLEKAIQVDRAKESGPCRRRQAAAGIDPPRRGKRPPLPEKPAVDCVFGQSPRDEIEVAKDDGQQVVEVVRDPPGQRSQALLLLGPLHPEFELAVALLGLSAIGDVLNGYGAADDAAFGIADRRRAVEHVSLRAVESLDLQFLVHHGLAVLDGAGTGPLLGLDGLAARGPVRPVGGVIPHAANHRDRATPESPRRRGCS